MGLIQQANNTGNGATLVVTLGAAPTNGNALVCLVVGRYGGLSIGGITGGGVTWVFGVQSNIQQDAEIWYGLNASSGGTAITITSGLAGQDIQAVVAEFSVIPTSSANDGTGHGQSGPASPADTGLLTTTNASDLLLAVAGDQSGATIGTSLTAGWTDFAVPTPTATLSIRASYQFVTATGSYKDTWTDTTPITWDAVIYALKADPPAGWSLYRPYTLGAAALDVLTGGLYYYWRRRKQEKPDE